jgi:hypothetical protein
MKKLTNIFLVAFLMLFHLPCSARKHVGNKEKGEALKEEILPIGSLIFDSGVFPMHRAEEVTKWEKARGAEVDVISVFPSRESWTSLLSSWFMDDKRIPAGFQGTLNIGMPLYPRDGNLEEASKGSYNAEWEKFGRMVAAKYPTAYIRVGWEMNLNDWYYKATPHNAARWIASYRHAVTSLKKGSSTFRFIFNPNIGPGQTGTEDATDFYPGDAYVDLIGVDAYDWWPPYTTEENIAYHCERKYGWDWWLEFAKSRNKKFCLPEWGVATANNNSGGDNPAYINFVYSWLKENRKWVAMECYFHEADAYIRSDLFTGYNPEASAAYKSWMQLLKK